MDADIPRVPMQLNTGEAKEFAQPRYETVESLRKPFKWATHLIDPANISAKFDSFVSSTQFPVEAATLAKSNNESFNFCGDIYRKVLFPPGSPELPYHNLDHAKITSITAQKIFFGGLVQEARTGKIPLVPKERLEQLHRLFSLVGSFHEIDDWWNRPYPGTTGEENPHINDAKTAISGKLAEWGLSAHDFNRFLLVDDFREAQEVSLGKALALKRGEGFLPENGCASLLESFTPGEMKQIVTIASKALCSSDFLQVINPAYLQTMVLQAGPKTFYTGQAGPYALAAEMQLWRKNGLKRAGFGEPDGTVHWKDVKLNLEFFEGVALPRINSGLDYLQTGAPSEYDNAQRIIGDKLRFLRHALMGSRLNGTKQRLQALMVS